jgi:regulatory factor X
MDHQHNHQNSDESYLLPSPYLSGNLKYSGIVPTNDQSINDPRLKEPVHQPHLQYPPQHQNQHQNQHQSQIQLQHQHLHLHQQIQQSHMLPLLPNPQTEQVKPDPNFGFGPALHVNQQLPYKQIPSQTGVLYQPTTQRYHPQPQIQPQLQTFQYDFTNHLNHQKPSQYYLPSNSLQFNQSFQSNVTQTQATGLQIPPPMPYSVVPMSVPTSKPTTTVASQKKAPEDVGIFTSPSSTSTRKRIRKSDHAPQGDQGDNELKQLAFAASNTSLQELAMRIKMLENEDNKDGGFSPNTSDNHKFKENRERQRQMFGMVWLFNSCEVSPTAVVPRNRIYARYVHVCAEYNLVPLSPASFGKLVRILFPNLTTRRLGMRGQSKYHYCGIKLNGDHNNKQPKHLHGHSVSNLSGASQLIHSPGSSSNSSISFDNSPTSISTTNSPSFTPITSPSISASMSISDQVPSVAHLKYIPNLMDSINNNLLYPNESIQLPPIYPYIPKDSDYDIADTLFSLYKVHVNTLFESLRFMQLKKFFASFNNFNSILTAPVIKLYTNDRVIEWVKLCDFLMYKKMIRMLTKLQCQYSLPADLLEQLKTVSSSYVKNMSNNLLSSKVTKNLVVMKLKLAKNFTNLLNRLIKNIETGHAAMRIVNNGSEKQSMLHDWARLDISEIVNREISCSEQKIDLLIKVLKEDVYMLLDEDSNEDSTDKSSQGIMIRLSNYLADLPGRFSVTNPRLFILLSSNLLTTCLREISLTGGQGFGAWWIVRCWIDEFLAWIFELGGFLKDDFSQFAVYEKSEPLTSNDENHPQFDSTQGEVNHDRANTSFGTVDLLDVSYGFDKINTSGTGYFASTEGSAPTDDILLKFEPNVENILG